MNWPAILTPLLAPNLGFRGSDEPGQSTEGGFQIHRRQRAHQDSI